MKIDPSKKYKTRDGREVTSLMRAPEDRAVKYPWTGLIEGDGWVTWSATGKFCIEDEPEPEDLIEVREPREWTLVVAKDNPSYPDGFISGERCRNCNAAGQWESVRVREIIEP